MGVVQPAELHVHRGTRLEHRQLVLLLVHPGAGADLDVLADRLGELGERRLRLREELFGDVRVDRDGDPPPVQLRHVLADFAQHAEADALAREDVAASFAVAARLAQRLNEVLARSLSGHLDEPELGDLEDVGPRLVRPQRLREGTVDLLAVAGALHVDEVDDDQAAEVPEAELVHDLLDRLEVGLQDRLLEIALADEAAGVHVDRGERLALVDDERAAALEPDLALEVGVDLALETEAFEDREVLVVVLDGRLGVGDEAIDEALDVLVELLAVGDDPFRVVTREIAHDAQR